MFPRGPVVTFTLLGSFARSPRPLHFGPEHGARREAGTSFDGPPIPLRCRFRVQKIRRPSPVHPGGNAGGSPVGSQLPGLQCRRWLSPLPRASSAYAVRSPAPPPCQRRTASRAQAVQVRSGCSDGIPGQTLGAGRSKSWPQDRQITVTITTMRRGLAQSGHRSASAIQSGSAAWHCGQTSTCSPRTTARAQGDLPLTGSVWILSQRKHGMRGGYRASTRLLEPGAPGRPCEKETGSSTASRRGRRLRELSGSRRRGRCGAPPRSHRRA